MKPEIMSAEDLRLGMNVGIVLLLIAAAYVWQHRDELKQSRRIPKKQYPSALDEHEEKLSA